MPLLPRISDSPSYGRSSPVPDRVRVKPQERVWWAIAMLVYSTGYPLLGLALWMGVRDGGWARASMLVALGVVTSFLGWGLLSYSDAGGESGASRAQSSRSRGTVVFLALYNRVGAIVILLASYTVTASKEGWPSPESFAGWFAVVWVPLFAAFALPVERAPPPLDANE